MTISIGRETKTHILLTKINETILAKVSSSSNKLFFQNWLTKQQQQQQQQQ